MTDTKATAQAAIDALGLKIRAEFVPFSASRNRDEKNDKGKPRYSLNWRVTLVRIHGPDNEAGRDILTTDYSAGIGHCPGYAAKTAPSNFRAADYKTHDGKPYPGTTSMHRAPKPHERLAQYRDAIAAAECESGFPMELDLFSREIGNTFKRKPKSSPLMPDPVDVIYSLIQDASVLDAGSFEDWAAELGYDRDSRKAETIYRACLGLALALRHGIGESGMEALRAAFLDY